MEPTCGHGSPAKNLGRIIAGLVFAVGGGYYLWMQHRAHVLQYLPLAFFLLCPLMHISGGCHGKHDAHGGSGDQKGGDRHG